MNWDALQVFLAVARAGRISAAARRLDVEHTTISRRLAALEEELGVPLFYRTSTGYVMTAHGRNVLAHAEAMERAALGVTARAREHAGEHVGRVRVALAPEFASDWLAPNLPSFRASYPRIVLQALVGTRQRDLSRGEAELAVESVRVRHQGLVSVRIARTTLALYASSAVAGQRRSTAGGHRSSGTGMLRIRGRDDLRDLALLVYTSPLHMLQQAKWFEPLLASGNVVLETNGTQTLLAAARAGVGVAVLPRFVARRYEDLTAVSDPVAEHDIWLTMHPEFRRDPKVRATADFLKRIAAGANGLS